VFSLTGKVAAVTGAGSGIGEAIATLFGRQGAHVIVIDLAPESAAQTVERIRGDGGRADALTCNVADGRGVRDTFAAIDAAAGRVDILVNNAGIAHIGNLATTTEADFDRVYEVNVKGVYHCAQAAISRMLAQGGGVILNMSSITALVGVADRFAYSMSKGAVLTMTMSIALDYMKQNIRCNCICPARIHTPFVDQFVARHYAGREQEVLAQLAAYQPMGRMGRADEVAALALYLCSDEAAFVTGQAYPIDGGVLVT
jgi:NAD(P)-dependent dehydrogenase (short-subunit alcohol dehydrogenase family)